MQLPDGFIPDETLPEGFIPDESLPEGFVPDEQPKESILQHLARGVNAYTEPIPFIQKPLQTISAGITKGTEAIESGLKTPGLLEGIRTVGKAGVFIGSLSPADIALAIATGGGSLGVKLAGNVEKKALQKSLLALRKVAPTMPIERAVEIASKPATQEALTLAEHESEVTIAALRKSQLAKEANNAPLPLPESWSSTERIDIGKPPPLPIPNTIQGALSLERQSALEALKAKLPKEAGIRPTIALETSLTPKPAIPPIPTINAIKPIETIENPVLNKPGFRQKGFLETVETSRATTPELKEKILNIKPQEYEQLRNAKVMQQADTEIGKKGHIKAFEDVMTVENPTPVDVGIALKLAKNYELSGHVDKVEQLVNKYDQVFRSTGQISQLASLWNRLTPMGFVRTVSATLEKQGIKLDEDFKKILATSMTKIRNMKEGKEKIEATFTLLNSISEKAPLSVKINNWLDGYRYTNMLSNPLTHERNLYGNMLQTFLTKPLDMGGEWTYSMIKHPFNPIARDIQLMDIPKYYQAVFKSIPEASHAFLDALTSNRISDKIMDISGPQFMNEAMRKRLPKVLKVVSGLMEGSDRFFSVMIKSGEKARLIRKGMSNDLAEIQAKKLAEKMLYRQRLGTLNKGDTPYFVRALDELGNLALWIRKQPVIGKPASWFAPFVTTPINIAKAGIERSLLGFIGGKYTDEQMGKALVGSVVMLTGGTMALQGKVVWLPPIGEKEKQAFYNSGRIPMSVEINGKYVPAWWFGPFAISLMLPEAFNYYVKESKQVLSQSEITALSKAILSSGRLITEQTPMAGIRDLMDVLSGKEVISPKTFSRPIGQVIPFEGALRFIANIVDPIYRKSSGLLQELRKNIPGMTKGLPAYEKSPGIPSERDFSSKYLPYRIGEKDRIYDSQFKALQRKAQIKYMIEQHRKRKP